MGKIKRNTLCSCGSGRKHKKCCLPKVIAFAPPSMPGEGRQLISTTTKEFMSPIRLYYSAANPRQFITYLSKLDCVDYYEDGSCVINYCSETKKIDLDVAYNKVPEMLYPIILAHCTPKPNLEEVHVDLRSFKRAICIIKIIDKYVPRDVAFLHQVATYNRLIFASSPQAAMNFTRRHNYDNIFSRAKAESGTEEMLTDLPAVQKFTPNIYEYGLKKGLKLLDSTLIFRLSVACGISKGDKRTIFNFIYDTINKSSVK